jgi:hypothetical protein
MHAKCLNKPNIYTFRLIVGFIQHYQSQLQQDLGSFSSSNAILIATLDSSFKDLQCQTSVSIKAKVNSAMLTDMPASHQSAMAHFNNSISQFIVKYIYLSGSEGAYTACKLIVECHHKLIKLIMAFDHHELIKLINGLVGHHKLSKLINSLIGYHKLIKLITTFSHNKLIKLVKAFGHNKLIKLITALGHNTAFGHNMAFGLITAFSHNELIKLITAFGHN